MATITKEDILRTADLVRLELTDDEAEKYSEQITEILTFTEKINEINTDDVAPTTNGNTLTNVMRDDVPVQWDKQAQAIENAPEQEDGQIKVPAIMD